MNRWRRPAAILGVLAGIGFYPIPLPHSMLNAHVTVRAHVSDTRHRLSSPKPKPSLEQQWLDSKPARCIRQAESGDLAHPAGDYSRGGLEPYGGAWEFSVAEWQGIGFSGLPNQASPAVQDAAAFKNFTLYGWGQWQTAYGCGV